MMALLHPMITQDNYPNSIGFIYWGMPFRQDFFWDRDGQNVMGYVLSDARYVLRCIATYIDHYRKSTTLLSLPYESQTMGPGIHTSEIPQEIFLYLQENTRQYPQSYTPVPQVLPPRFKSP